MLDMAFESDFGVFKTKSLGTIKTNFKEKTTFKSLNFLALKGNIITLI